MITELEIAGFRNYPFFSTNTTVPGRACYLSKDTLTVENFEDNCLSKVSGSEDYNWVIIIKFDTENFLSVLNTIYKDLPLVKSVIFSYEGTPHIPSPAPDKTSPEIISFGRGIDIREINLSKYSFPRSDEYFIEHSHKYTEFCEVMNPSFKFYLIAIAIWGLITVFHILWTWILRKDYSKHLQKILLFIPVFFAGYTLIDYVFFLSCPWDTKNGVQYLQIIQIALVTIFNTLFVGLCCFISKGWAIVRNSFTREELSSITMIVGIFYLVYSAYFIASDISSLRVIITVVLIIMYLWVALT